MAITTVQQIGGAYQQWAEAGKVFVAKTGAAIAIPINTATTAAPTLWNPSNSGKKLIPIRIAMSFAAIGTQVQAGMTLGYILSTGETVATGLPIATFTNIPPTNLKLGDGNVARAKYANATVTFTAAYTVFLDLGMGQNVQGTAANGEPYTLRYDFNGELVILPGTAIVVGATAATSGTYITSITYAELDLDE